MRLVLHGRRGLLLQGFESHGSHRRFDVGERGHLVEGRHLRFDVGDGGGGCGGAKVLRVGMVRRRWKRRMLLVYVDERRGRRRQVLMTFVDRRRRGGRVGMVVMMMRVRKVKRQVLLVQVKGQVLLV